MARRFAMGWQRDVPDLRDYSPKQDEVHPMLKSSKALRPPKAGIPSGKDLTPWCSPVEDQESLGSCTANAAVGLMEYFERRAFGRHIEASRLFIYKTTRNLLGWTGDTGAWLRTTMKAMVLFGAPPERYCPYEIANFDDEPGAFLYSFAGNFKSMVYYRLDSTGMSPSDVLTRVKAFLAAGYPSMFGFTVYSFGNEKGEFPFPGPGDSVQGGHAVVAVGYDDKRAIGGETGAIRIRNSWGPDWGEAGYGWLPYRYVEEGLAVDFWSMFKQAYLETGNFE